MNKDNPYIIIQYNTTETSPRAPLIFKIIFYIIVSVLGVIVFFAAPVIGLLFTEWGMRAIANITPDFFVWLGNISAIGIVVLCIYSIKLKIKENIAEKKDFKKEA